MTNLAFAVLHEVSPVDLSSSTEALVKRGLIAPGPEIAARRIRDTFSCDLATNGKDCSGIIRTRELIAEFDPHLACALLIGAPHTHWERGDYILEKYSAERDAYLIGPSQVLPQQLRLPLTPLSFVFHEGGPTAYEWADASSGISLQEDLSRLWRGVQALNDAVVDEFGDEPFPLGVSVNHRFKDLWGTPKTGTNEQPAPEDARYAIVTRASTDAPGPEGTVQVGWSAFLSEEYTAREREILAKLDEALGHLEPAEAERTLEELEQHARRLVEQREAT